MAFHCIYLQPAEHLTDFNTVANQQGERYPSTIHSMPREVDSTVHAPQQLGQASWQQATWPQAQLGSELPLPMHNQQMPGQQHFNDLNPLYNGYTQQ